MDKAFHSFLCPRVSVIVLHAHQLAYAGRTVYLGWLHAAPKHGFSVTPMMYCAIYRLTVHHGEPLQHRNSFFKCFK